MVSDVAGEICRTQTLDAELLQATVYKRRVLSPGYAVMLQPKKNQANIFTKFEASGKLAVTFLVVPRHLPPESILFILFYPRLASLLHDLFLGLEKYWRLAL